MLLSDMSQKEIVDGNQAKKLGLPGQIDLVFDENSGQIRELVILSSPFRKKAGGWRFPWEDIIKIGEDVLIMDTDKRYFDRKN
ncbi:YlmC/YmxH family sporulation protein [Salibacterium sp. K-3]